MTLASAPLGVPLVLGQAALPAPRRLRLAELGLRAGATVTVLRRTAGGGRIVGIGDARVAVGRTVLMRMPAVPTVPAMPVVPVVPAASVVPTVPAARSAEKG